jgi:phospholipid/cholesterol/gamma-HCH transport system substrate-binding protein
METRANHIWVGLVTLALLALLAGFIVWLARLDQNTQNEYDILFKQAVDGLANGSQVSFSGVPVGQVSSIQLWKQDPEFVRVRIRVKEDVPMLVGTTATIQASFTGVSTILLDGAVKDAPPITCETTACPDGLPVIPPGRGGFGEIVSNAPLLLERLATLTERLTQVLDDNNQNEIAAILENTTALTGNANDLTETLAQTSPKLSNSLDEFDRTLADTGQALQSFERLMDSTDVLVQQEGPQISGELRETLKTTSATIENLSKTADELSKTLEDVRPATRQLSNETLPSAEATLEDLRATSRALRKVTEQLETQGIGSLVSGQPLPDYEP